MGLTTKKQAVIDFQDKIHKYIKEKIDPEVTKLGQVNRYLVEIDPVPVENRDGVQALLKRRTAALESIEKATTKLGQYLWQLAETVHTLEKAVERKGLRQDPAWTDFLAAAARASTRWSSLQEAHQAALDQADANGHFEALDYHF